MQLVKNRLFRGMLAAGASVLLWAAVPRAQQSPLKWVKLAPLPEPAQEIGGIAANGKVWVLGGLAIGSTPLTSAMAMTGK